LLNKKLREFIIGNIKDQSLKGIGGRSKIAFQDGQIETTISHTTLYNYINNIRVDFIDNSALKRQRKKHYRLKYGGKRQNGISINERPQPINDRTEFGH
jgi:IS30 family transposase